MSIVNKLVKYTGYFGIFLVTLIESYLIALLGTGIVMSLACSVWSFIRPLPELVVRKFGVIYLLVSVPLGIFVFIYTLVKVKPKG